jgi:hypothetical protein
MVGGKTSFQQQLYLFAFIRLIIIFSITPLQRPIGMQIAITLPRP